MDSGWFAVDAEGNLAHFETGEAGALPNDVRFATGEASGYDGPGNDLWVSTILPWIARNVPDAQIPDEGELLALFDTVDHAEAAVALGGTQYEDNPLLVEVHWSDDGRIDRDVYKTADGFVGFTPGQNDLLWAEELEAILPIVSFAHGEWDIPGHYIKKSAPVKPLKVDGPLLNDINKMNIVFAKVEEIQLADFYTNEQCISWSNADLRTGEPKEGEGFWTRLKNIFKR